LNALRYVEQTCFPKDAWPIFDLIAVLSFPGVVRLKAVVENEWSASLLATHVRRRLFVDRHHWVLPEYRGKGYGRALLEACEARLTTKRVRLSVRASNLEPIRMYEKAGYRFIDQWLRYYDDGKTRLLWKRIENRAQTVMNRRYALILHSPRPIL